ncbi:MAG: arginine--tRNA ligase [Halobacteriaceae archaeon]
MFPAFRDEVATAVAEALASLGYPTGDLGVEEPPGGVDAALATSVAFRLAGAADAPPPAVAAEIASAIDPGAHDLIGGVEAQGPYVNFTPAPAYDRATLSRAVDDDWGRRPDTGESIVVEHTSANPTGPLHVGRARNTIVGDALARLLDYAGHDVDRHYYVNDAGRQVAILTWAHETIDEDELPDPERDRPDYDLVRYYRAGTERLEREDDTAEAEAEIEAIMQGLEDGDEAAYERVRSVVDEMLSGMQVTLDRLPARFDRWVHETTFMRDGSTDDVAERLADSEHAALEEGAWQLDLSPWGIEKNLVFRRSDGTSLYPTRDIAHHEWKLDQFDRAVTVLGEDHKLQADQVEAALDLLGADTDRLSQVFASWVNLPEGSMSTRQGTGVDLDDLLDEAIERARREVEDRLDDRIRDDDLDEEDIDRIARQVGIGAVRFDVVATQPTKSITFRWAEALDFEAQSAPYVQYAHARCCGILDEAGADRARTDGAGTTAAAALPDDPGSVADALTHDAERALLRAVARFPAVIEDAAAEHEPHRVATFARTFADQFNTFYRQCPVLDADGDRRTARLALVAAAQSTLANALDVLGVEAPTSM